MSRSFADQLARLFEVVRGSDGRRYTSTEVVEAISRAGTATVSASYLSELLSGKKDNPSIWTVKALADFFGQPIDYFTDPAAAPVTAQTRRSSRMALLLSLIRDRDDQTLDLARLAREAEAIGAHVTEDDLRAVRDGSVASLPATRTDELARYFGLPPAALAEEIAGHAWAEQLPESHVLADEGVRKIAFRAHALSPADREIINRLLDRLSREEGLSPDDLPF